jgi:hypothetical protein
MHFRQNNGKLECTVDIDVKGDIIEYLSSENKNIFNEKSIAEIKEILQKEIERQVSLTVDKTKELGIDFLGIGLEMYRKHPRQWKVYRETWNKGTYKNIPIYVEGTVDIQNTGILQ